MSSAALAQLLDDQAKLVRGEARRNSTNDGLADAQGVALQVLLLAEECLEMKPEIFGEKARWGSAAAADATAAAFPAAAAAAADAAWDTETRLPCPSFVQVGDVISRAEGLRRLCQDKPQRLMVSQFLFLLTGYKRRVHIGALPGQEQAPVAVSSQPPCFRRLVMLGDHFRSIKLHNSAGVGDLDTPADTGEPGNRTEATLKTAKSAAPGTLAASSFSRPSERVRRKTRSPAGGHSR